MIILPKDAQAIKVENSTVDFYTFSQAEITYFYFDTSDRAAPEPMINAMNGLSLLQSAKDKLIMVNHQKPMGLLGKLQDSFEIEIYDLDDGNYQLIFTYKQESSDKADLSDTSCAG